MELSKNDIPETGGEPFNVSKRPRRSTALAKSYKEPDTDESLSESDIPQATKVRTFQKPCHLNMLKIWNICEITMLLTFTDILIQWLSHSTPDNIYITQWSKALIHVSFILFSSSHVKFLNQTSPVSQKFLPNNRRQSVLVLTTRPPLPPLRRCDVSHLRNVETCWIEIC